jgi:hypothetical protein
MEISERIAIAQAKVKTIIETLRTLQQLRANNEFILYSDRLRKQVGTSYAANAFNIMGAVLYEGELIKICSLWDPARHEQEARDRNSIPAVAWLITPNDVVETLRVERVKDRMKVDINPPEGPMFEWQRELALKRAEAEGAKVGQVYQATQSKIAEAVKSELLIGMRNFRDKHIAHSLVQTKLEKAKGEVDLPKYGHEKELLDLSIDIANDLYFVACDASYLWDISWNISNRYAASLLSKCDFNILE